ncbi:MAG TPA: methylmalonyl-CoA epimerase [Thermoplasmata archaeon]|nr:methylmalonyl-CoA epimerase [Thermoplasmata archaeon]
MIGPVHHVGIAVRDLDAAIARYRALGLREGPPEDVASAGVRVVFLESGGALVELVTPLHGDTALGRFLEKRGEGLHHLAFRVEDIRAELARLEREGFELVDRAPRPGAHGRTVAFLHPRSAHGTLIELVQDAI